MYLAIHSVYSMISLSQIQLMMKSLFRIIIFLLLNLQKMVRLRLTIDYMVHKIKGDLINMTHLENAFNLCN
jgi:hypothetical protein